jgi:hypothetical protein
MTDLSTLIEPLKREVSAPGEFFTTFPSASDDDLVGRLADGFSQAQLDGWFSANVLDLVNNTVTPDLSVPGRALTVFYSAAQVIRGQLRNMAVTQRYKSGPVEYETQYGPSILTNELNRINGRITQLITWSSRGAGTTTVVYDAYFSRAAEIWANEAIIAAQNSLGSSFFAGELIGTPV